MNLMQNELFETSVRHICFLPQDAVMLSMLAKSRLSSMICRLTILPPQEGDLGGVVAVQPVR
jgi:hypothetical protein